MAALAEAKSLGLTRRIGVSNFNIELTRQAIAAVGAGEISTNQIELSPYLQNRALTAYLEEQGIAVTSYMTLAYGKVLEGPDAGRDSRQAPGHGRPGGAGLGDATGLRGDSVLDPPREPRQQPAGARRLDAGDMARIAGLERNGREVSPQGPGAGLGLRTASRVRRAEAPVARPVQSFDAVFDHPGLSATQSYRRCALWLLSWVCQ